MCVHDLYLQPFQHLRWSWFMVQMLQQGLSCWSTCVLAGPDHHIVGNARDCIMLFTCLNFINECKNPMWILVHFAALCQETHRAHCTSWLAYVFHSSSIICLHFFLCKSWTCIAIYFFCFCYLSWITLRDDRDSLSQGYMPTMDYGILVLEIRGYSLLISWTNTEWAGWLP